MSRFILGRYCPKCDYTYFSRSRHDFNCCPCYIESGKKTGGYVDGGRDYLKVGGAGSTVRLPMYLTDEELYEDWKSGLNRYGLIKGRVGFELEPEGSNIDRSQIKSLGESGSPKGGFNDEE